LDVVRGVACCDIIIATITASIAASIIIILLLILILILITVQLPTVACSAPQQLSSLFNIQS
jgi:hypothetical protein